MKTLGAPIAIERMLEGSCWELCADLNGFASPPSDVLITQVAMGRSFQLIDDLSKHSLDHDESFRLEVRLLEDGYKCWLNFSEIMGRAFYRGAWKPRLLTNDQIHNRIPFVLRWLDKAASLKNQYLWGGTIGPDFDCSGLIQAAFASQQIWLPRDAYQQERFCETLQISFDNYSILRPGDLLFFGTLQQCKHVGIYIGSGIYCHSSGTSNGRNGIGYDALQQIDKSSVAAYYRAQLRGAGRVVCCHDGVTLP